VALSNRRFESQLHLLHWVAGEAGSGGEYLRVPDDVDPAEGGAPEETAAEQDEWEVRGLIRILRDINGELV